MKRPIVFIHSFNHPYLPLSLWQARQSNPDSEIFLIGDGWNAHFGFLVTHINAAQYSTSAREFASHFKNFSTNPHHFELVCLQRWFILEEFMKAKGFENCLYLDSDILLYGNSTEDGQSYSSFGMTISGISGHSNFINKLGDLREFCSFIREAYVKPNGLQILEEKYRLFRETHEAGGISDMTFFTSFKEKFPDKILDISKPLNGMVYDIAMAYIEFFPNENGIKKVERELDGKIKIRQRGVGEIELRSLHFQGEAKRFMKAHVYDFPAMLWLLHGFNKGYLLFQRILKKGLSFIR